MLLKTKSVHNLKTVQPYFDDVKCGLKQFEIRKNDRDFKIGDLLMLTEYDAEAEKLTGNACYAYITYVCNDERYCKEGYVVLGIKQTDYL